VLDPGILPGGKEMGLGGLQSELRLKVLRARGMLVCS
jgi:hypothetical protein